MQGNLKAPDLLLSWEPNSSDGIVVGKVRRRIASAWQPMGPNLGGHLYSLYRRRTMRNLLPDLTKHADVAARLLPS